MYLKLNTILCTSVLSSLSMGLISCHTDENSTPKKTALVTDTSKYLELGSVSVPGWTPDQIKDFDFRRPPKSDEKALKELLKDVYAKIDSGENPDYDGAIEKEISCYFIEPDPQDPPGGRTSKFKCNFSYMDDGEVKYEDFKVKYDPVAVYESNMNRNDATGDKLKAMYQEQMPELALRSNAEVYGEVLATRLLSGLGFHADRIYPFVKLKCYGCPIEPWSYTRIKTGTYDFRDDQIRLSNRALGELERLPEDEYLLIENGIIEEKTEGVKIEVQSPNSIESLGGFHWTELMNANVSPEECLDREALSGLIAFINHMDNKPDQQRIVCAWNSKKAKKKIKAKADKGTLQAEDCDYIKLMVQDAGSNYGNGFAPIANIGGSLGDAWATILEIMTNDPSAFGDYLFPAPNNNNDLKNPRTFWRFNKLDREAWQQLNTWRSPDSCILGINTLSLGGVIPDTFDQVKISGQGYQRFAERLNAMTEDQLKAYFNACRVQTAPRGIYSYPEFWTESFKIKRERDFGNSLYCTRANKKSSLD